MPRRVIVVALALLAFTPAACGGDSGDGTETDREEAPVNTERPPQTGAPAPTPGEGERGEGRE